MQFLQSKDFDFKNCFVFDAYKRVFILCTPNTAWEMINPRNENLIIEMFEFQ